MNTKTLLALAATAAFAAIAAAILLSGDGATVDREAFQAVSVARAGVQAEDRTDRPVEDLASLGGEEEGRASVELAPEPLALDGADAATNVDEDRARVVTVELQLPAGAPADGELRLIGWSEAEVDGEDVNWRDEGVRRRFRRRSSGASALRSISEYSDEDELLWSVSAAAPSGPIELRFDQDATEGLIQLDGRYLFLAEPIEVNLAAGIDRVIVQPELGAWVTGVVQAGGVVLDADEDGSFGTVSLSGGTMSRGRGRGMGWTDRRTELDEELQFEFRGVRPDLTLTVSVDVPSLAPGRSEALELQPGARVNCPMTLSVGGRIAGRVVDEGGAPVAGATLKASGQRGMMFGGRSPSREATSDGDGAYELRGLSAGEYSVAASLEGWRGGKTPERVEVEDGMTRTGTMVTMVRGLRIDGTVVMPDGSAAAGVPVRLEQARASSGSSEGRRNFWGGRDRGPERKEVVTEVDGTFSFEALTETAARLVASAEVPGEDGSVTSLVAISEDVEPGAAEPLELALRPTLALAGIVLDDMNQPVTEFEVRAAREGFSSRSGAGDGLRKTIAAEDGRFSVAGLSAGTWTVSIRASGYTSPDDQTQTLTVPQVGPEPRFVLERRGSVRGVVIGPGGVPIAGATVTQAQQGGGFGGWGRRQEGVTSGEDGTFEIEELKPGAQSFEASSDDWAKSEAASVEVVAGEVADGLVLELRRGGRISGIVRDAEGSPWSGRRVTYAQGGGPMAMFGGSDTATTDSTGSFTFERVPPGQWTVNASPGEREMFKTFEGARDESAFLELMAQNLSQQVDVEDGGAVFVELGAEPREPVVVFGEVTRGGAAVTGGNVTFALEGGDLFANLKRADLQAGAYRIELDRPGAYLVSVERGARRNGFLIDVRAGGEQRVNLELPEGGIAGRVTDSDGRPAAGIRVTAEPSTSFSFNRFDPRSTSTDAEGRYELEDLDPGTYALRVGSRGWGRGGGSTGEAFGVALVEGVQVSATSITGGVNVQLSSPGRVIGQVVNRDGAPVAGATIFVREASGRPVDAISTVRSGADGRFSYSRVNPGSYLVSARGDGKASEAVDGVVVTSGQDTEVRLEVEAGSNLVVRTVEKDDTPVRAEVTVVDSDGREVSGLVGTELFRSFGEGVSTTEQRFGPLAPGRYTVTAKAQDGRTERKRVTVKGSRDTRTRLRFDPVPE